MTIQYPSINLNHRIFNSLKFNVPIPQVNAYAATDDNNNNHDSHLSSPWAKTAQKYPLWHGL